MKSFKYCKLSCYFTGNFDAFVAIAGRFRKKNTLSEAPRLKSTITLDILTSGPYNFLSIFRYEPFYMNLTISTKCKKRVP